MSDRLIQAPLLCQRITQIVVRLRIPRLESQRLPVFPDSLGQFVLDGESIAVSSVHGLPWKKRTET